MAWIESHQSLAKHRKLLRLSGILRVDRVTMIGHLHLLWWWGMDNADIDGSLGDVTPYELAEAAEWRGDPQEFASALVEAGFVDLDDDGGYVLHDWYDYAGKLNERRERDRIRKQVQRRAAKRASGVRTTSAGRPPDVHDASECTKPNLPNLPSSSVDALGTRKEIAATSDADRSGFQPATAAHLGIDDDSITPGRYFERLWGVYPQTIDDLFQGYEDKLHPSAVKWAVYEARLAGQRRASYLRAILDRLVAQGLTTAAAAQAYEEERRHRDRPPKAASMDGAPNAGAYREIDRETVDRYAALIYAAGEAAVADDADAGAADAADKPP